MQRGNRLLHNQRCQLLRVAVSSGSRHHQRGAVYQRPEKLPHRDVKAERGFLQHPIHWAQAIGVLHPGQAVVQRTVTIACAFGAACRSRGVNHIRQVVCARQVWQVAIAVFRPRLLAGLQAQHGQTFRQRQTGQYLRLSQQQTDGAVFKQVGQALSRVLRVERHISATGLQNRQQTDHQFQGTLAGHAHPHFRADAQRTQLARQTIGPLIQRLIAQALSAKHQRTGIRGPCRLSLDV